MSKQLVEAIVDMREEEALKLVREMVDCGSEPMAILDEVREAMDLVGKRYDEGIYYLPELVLAGEMMNQINELVKPKLTMTHEIKRRGKVVIGTVEGDIHDIGKNMVTFMLDVNGFEVLDLGVNVPPQKFIDAIREFQPQVIGLSGFLTLAFDAMKDTIVEITNAGLREKVKIMVGGGQVNDQVKAYAGADAYGKSAMMAVNLAAAWIGE